MKRIHWSWHTLAHAVALSAALACSGSEDPAEAAAPDDPQTRESSSDDASRRLDTEETAHDILAPQTLTVHVHNGSTETRSRYQPCAGTYDIGIRPGTLGSLPQQPTCERIDCATLSAGEALSSATACSSAACQPARRDLEPGEADTDYQWDGVFFDLTERNCYDPTTFEVGTPMIARVCFGAPGPGDFDIQSTRCTDHPFAYGTPTLDIELE